MRITDLIASKLVFTGSDNVMLPVRSSTVTFRTYLGGGGVGDGGGGGGGVGDGGGGCACARSCDVPICACDTSETSIVYVVLITNMCTERDS